MHPSSSPLSFPRPRSLRPPSSMSQRHSDSSLEERLLEYRFHSELQLDANGNPRPKLPIVRGTLHPKTNDAFEPESSVPPLSPAENKEPRAIVLSTQSPAALKMGTQQLIPRSLAVASKAKTPTRHQSFGAAMLSKEAARRDPQLLSAPSFSLDDMDMDVGPGGALSRNRRNQSYREAMRGLGSLSSQGGSNALSPKLQTLAEEPSQPATQCPAKNKVGASWGQWAQAGPQVPRSQAARGGVWSAPLPHLLLLCASLAACRVLVVYSSAAQRPGGAVDLPFPPYRQATEV